jgi:hypothetical protein
LAAGFFNKRKPALGKSATPGGFGRQGGEATIVGVDEAAYERVVQLSVAGDKGGLADLVRSRKAFLVSNGTLVRVIGRGSLDVCEVRIMGAGQYAGHRGFVAVELIISE